MSTNALPPVRIGHPAPHRDRVGLTALLFGIAAAPLAWNIQLLVGASFTGFACYPHATPLPAPVWSGMWPFLLAGGLIGIGIALAGGWVSWRSWRRTSKESPGSAHHLLDRGEGRTRFLAMCGMMTSALFLIALAFTTAALCIVPLCGG